jgi:hypothetical protein
VESRPRTFTREEAEALLPEVDRLAAARDLEDGLHDRHRPSEGEDEQP